MVISFSVTEEPNNLPPRVRLDLDTGSATTVFETIEIRRDGELIRATPTTGFQTAIVYDYDAPSDVTATYTVTGTTSGLTTLRAETWPNLTGWGTVSGSPAVSGGKLTAGKVSRTIAGAFPAAGRLVGKVWDGSVGGQLQVGPLLVNSVSYLGQHWDQVFLLDEFDAPTGDAFRVPNNVGSDFVLTWGTGVVKLTTSEGTGQMSSNPARATNPIVATNTLPGFTYSSAASGVTFGPLSDTAVLAYTEAWLIHPTTPDLSVQISNGDRKDRIYVRPESGKRVSYPSQREIFEPMNRTRKVPVTYGNRRPGEWTLVLMAPRDEDRASLRSILSDQSPLLLRYPTAFPWDLDQDWYSVDDVDDDRLFDSPTSNPRDFSLPLIPVDAPVLTQGAQWTYARDLSRNPTYADSLNEFPTYTDRVLGPPAA